MLKIVERVARFMAVIGGLVLSALVVLTCVSVLGRGLNSLAHSDAVEGMSRKMRSMKHLADRLVEAGVGPINGDFEILEAGVAFAIFAFLPICQLYGSHATVDIFTNALPRKANKLLITFWEIILTVVIVLITVRLFAGLESKYAYGDTTFLLQFPIWWSYALSFFAACVASLVGIYCALARVAEVVTGRRFMPYSEEAVH
ncbi:TRAP transporter small permease [Shimia sp. FJ5]|uniref:TRAP transporter small permease n=1 Tax=Shimia sp. FJ5 TaxID=3079054 RepID=UPI0026334853|nr:TRAP transporter small permease [Shimia sp. FJ5]MDV4143612.1 TRAP transporter small permease [Shimia sp. FJ5]